MVRHFGLGIILMKKKIPSTPGKHAPDAQNSTFPPNICQMPSRQVRTRTSKQSKTNAGWCKARRAEHLPRPGQTGVKKLCEATEVTSANLAQTQSQQPRPKPRHCAVPGLLLASRAAHHGRGFQPPWPVEKTYFWQRDRAWHAL